MSSHRTGTGMDETNKLARDCINLWTTIAQTLAIWPESIEVLRINQNLSAAGAKGYYTTADYYGEGQELVGRWRGEAARRLGLSGQVAQAEWDALCDNRDPRAGETLTQRQKTQRRVGYDFNFHAPKSLSLLHAVTQDERLLDAFREAVDNTMRDMEAEMQTRVRRDGQNVDRTTGNMVWGEFVHLTARPVDGVPDPHLHAHCFVFNTTWDGTEERWKAGQFAGIKRDAPYFEALFHSRLARRVEELGLRVERTRERWELACIPKTAIDRFSRRTARIEAKAKELGITEPGVKGELGATTRERKRADLPMDELRREWESRLSPEEREAVAKSAGMLGGEAIAEDHRATEVAVERAVDHCFERSAVVPERRVLARALRQAVGVGSPDQVKRVVATQGLLWANRDGERLATTRAVLEEEQRMIEFAKRGRGACRPLVTESHAFKRQWLNAGQRAAVEHVLEARDRVVVVRGAAGVGKTSMMQEAAEAIEAAGTRVRVFAPSADASRGVLRSEGFHDADTVARMLVDERLQSELHGAVIWIDEAGLLGSRTTAALFRLADRIDARIVLSGDRAQHGSVERGAVLRLLEEEAGVRSVEIKEIQRQKGEYRQAIEALSDGRTDEGFRRLDHLGWVKEVCEPDRYQALARDYVETVAEGKSALVVSPTHREGEWITDEIRSRLKRIGRLGGTSETLTVLENANLTEGERRDPLSYSPGDVLVFHQNAKGFTKGARVAVGDGPLPLAEAGKFQVFRANMLPVAAGDLLRVTRNGATLDGMHRLNNGAIHRVKGFSAEGDLVLENGWRVAKDFGHLAHGYVVTSHASQGKTVDRVLIGQSSMSFPASSREQFYVSASRGRQQAVVYTDDKRALLDAVRRSDDRITATELIADEERRTRAATMRRHQDLELTGGASNRESARVREEFIRDQ